MFFLYISVKGAFFWDAAVPSTRGLSAYWYVISSCSVDSKIKTDEFCNFIIKKLDLEDTVIPLKVMYFVFANWIKVKTWTWGYHHWMTCRRMTCLREFGKQQQVLRWLCAFLAHHHHHHHHTSARFPLSHTTTYVPPYTLVPGHPVNCCPSVTKPFWWRWWGPWPKSQSVKSVYQFSIDIAPQVGLNKSNSTFFFKNTLLCYY